MSRLGMVPGKLIEELLAKAPGALEADDEMRRVLIDNLTPALFSLIGVVVAGSLGCARFAADLRGPLDQALAAQAAKNWRALELTAREKAILSYAERGTLEEASVRRRDVDELRAVGLDDKDVLLIATAIAYHNYAIRMAAAFEVAPR